jgi:hypothetical protein
MYSKNNFEIIEHLKKNRFLIESLLMNFQKIETNKGSAMNKTSYNPAQKTKTKSL